MSDYKNVFPAKANLKMNHLSQSQNYKKKRQYNRKPICYEAKKAFKEEMP